ncbi:MAG: HEAT repeat domain-containing protein [Candidatus Cloacimonetes bacterium]|nr:HEAT repeat domain-containing protein [Candidatus Cloacimonadota bacterium]
MKKTLFLLLFIFLINLAAAETLTDQDREMLDIMLTRSGLELNSLNFLKDWSSGTKFKIPQMLKVLNNPLEYPVFVDRLAEKMESKERVELLADIMPVLAWEAESDNYAYQELFQEKQKEFEYYYLIEVNGQEGIFGYVEMVWDECEILRQQAFSQCNQSDLELWQYLSTSLWSEAEDSLEYNAYYEKYEITEPESIESDSLIALIEKIDLGMLFQATIVNRAGFEVMKHYLENRPLANSQAREYKSRYGLMRIGSSQSDLVEKDYAFIYDPQGNDTYLGRLETDWSRQPYFWQLDFAGDDYYHNDEIAGLVSVKGGIGILYDAEGDDVYTGADYSVSAIWGYAELWDVAGNDTYNLGLHSGGAATFGICLLVDEAGRDSYRVTQYGEGFGSTLGFGAIIDYEGFDNYYAGGKYLHVPLAPLDYRSLSQGFGFGMRPDLAGGIGMIYDEDGNDNYTGGVYSQAVAYWYALGIIYDKQGYDYYDSVYYPQGSGIHLAAGFLYDGAGEDHYYSKHGPGQGAAHDWAVGFLIDRSGNDHYSVEGGNGVALTNSVTIFLDGSGDDSYQRQEVNNYGYSRVARGTGGIGIFLDTGGNDKYPVENCANDSFWCRGYYGIGLDTLLVVEEKEVAKMAEEQAAEVDSLAAIKEIWELAAGWGVGSNQQTVQRAGEILLSRDEEAAAYIAENEIGTKSGLAYRAISEFNKKTDKLIPYAIEQLENPDSLVAKHCIGIIAEKGDSTYIDLFKPFLEEDKYTNAVLGSLGELNCAESVQILTAYCQADSEKRRVVTARSLLSLDREDSKAAFLQMADDESFIIRTMVKIYQDKQE